MLAQKKTQITPVNTHAAHAEKTVNCRLVKSNMMPMQTDAKKAAAPQPVCYDFVGIAG